MSTISSRSIMLIITVCYLIMHINAQAPNVPASNTPDGQGNSGSTNIDTPSMPVHNDTSRDNEGADHDSEPFRNNGRGTEEAQAQNYAAENNQIHGMTIEDFQHGFLNQHNIYRRQMCANDLQNDHTLHDIAQKRAHDKANGKQIDLSDDFGENSYEIDTGDPSKITADMIVKAWYDEQSNYTPGNESSAVHFSQVVWKGSNKLGVGHAYSSHKLFVYALYKPPGNIRGQFANNVGCGSTGQQNQANR